MTGAQHAVDPAAHPADGPSLWPVEHLVTRMPLTCPDRVTYGVRIVHVTGALWRVAAVPDWTHEDQPVTPMSLQAAIVEAMHRERTMTVGRLSTAEALAACPHRTPTPGKEPS